MRSQVEPEDFLMFQEFHNDRPASDIAVGRKVADVDVELLVGRVSDQAVRNYDVFYQGDQLDGHIHPIPYPDEWLDIVFRFAGE